MLNWKDGQPFSDRYGDVYFSIDSGLEETHHVFLQGNDLAERFADLRAGESFCIGETGFGTGLNFLCAWRLFEQTAPAGASLDFFSIERFPINDDELRAALALWPELGAQADVLLSRWHRRVPGWNRWSFANGRVRLTLAMEDVAQALPQLQPGCVDAWFLDGFSPSKNPEMWGDDVLSGIARASRAGATLATYTSAGWVRRGLQQAGFEVKRVPGFGRKREMVRGMLPSARAPSDEASSHSTRQQSRQVAGYPASGRGETPRTALVIGAGLAGCAAAHALAQRGVQVTLIDRAPQLASAASGNPRGILHARFGAGMNALHRVVLAAYGHALAMLDEVVPADGVNRAECGLLQLAATEAEAKRIGKLAAQEWPTHLLQAVDAKKASEVAGMDMAQGGLWFPAGGWVVPLQVCARLADHPDIALQFGLEVTALEQTAGGWRARGAGFEIEAEQVVVCCGHQARRLSQFAAFPLQPVRGQISVLPSTTESEGLKMVLCAEGYCAPAVDGLHVAGATSTFDDEAVDIRETDHADNLAKITAHMPSLHQALGGAGPLAGRAGVRCSVPGATPLVGEVAPPTSYWQSQPIAGGGALQSLPHQRTSSHRVATAPGLYCSLAHGTRGLLTAGLAAEVIASAMCGQLAPLPQELLTALAPSSRHKVQG